MPAGASDLIRSARNYFRVKGSALEVVPVVVVDDNSRGPFPPCRQWYGSGLQGPVVGQWSYVWAQNEDGRPGNPQQTGPGKSVMVVDEIFVKAQTVVDDFVIALSIRGNIVAGTTTVANDASEEKVVGDPTSNPVFGNVTLNRTAQAGQLWLANNSQVWPATFTAGTVIRIPGPFTLGPQGLIAVAPSLVNNGIFAMFRGRYYAAT